MITLTALASQHILRIANEQELNEWCLRVKVVGGGCAGYSYSLDFEDKTANTEQDEHAFSEGINVVVDPLSLQYLEGVVIDYIEQNFASGFKFSNPKSSGSCGCGSSFSA